MAGASLRINSIHLADPKTISCKAKIGKNPTLTEISGDINYELLGKAWTMTCNRQTFDKNVANKTIGFIPENTIIIDTDTGPYVMYLEERSVTPFDLVTAEKLTNKVTDLRNEGQKLREQLDGSVSLINSLQASVSGLRASVNGLQASVTGMPRTIVQEAVTDPSDGYYPECRNSGKANSQVCGLMAHRGCIKRGYLSGWFRGDEGPNVLGIVCIK